MTPTIRRATRADLSAIVGLSTQDRGLTRGNVEMACVNKRLRGRGIGEQMMDWAIATCRDRGCRLMQLTSNADRVAAHRFHTRLGWRQTHLGFKLELENA